MEREVSDSTTLVGGYFVDAASSVEDAEVEAKDTMLRALSDDMEYWGRISSAVLSHDDAQAHRLPSVAPEYQGFARMWIRTGRSLDIIDQIATYAKLADERFDRKQIKKAARALKPPKVKSRGGGGGGHYSAPAARRYGGGVVSDEVLFGDVIDTTPTFDVDETLTLLQGIDDIFLSNLDDGVASALPDLDSREQVRVAAVYDHMMHCFKHATHKRLYGYNSNDHQQQPLVFGATVPSYFANVVDQSIYRRKELSMAGLRNLVKYGSVIYDQLRAKKFSGNPQHYQGTVGMNLMREFTGNVVDLDTTVLRCSCKATLNAINASNKHKGEATYASVDAFGSSTQAQDIAIHCSIPLLQDFAKLMDLTTAEQLSSRSIDPNTIGRPVPVASNNADRGRVPVWQYINCGQNSFHCNVPTMDDVNGALLRAPFRCARIWATLMSLYRNEPAELAKRIADFFENCIVDSCFNMKWKAIEEFDASMQHEGTIVDVLQREQMNSQKLFTMEFFDADDEKHSKEIALMYSLVQGRVAASVKEGRRLREITAEDVALWVEDPSIAL